MNITNNKSVAANIIWQLWQHLLFRYLNKQQTKIMRSQVADKDFQIILDEGVDILDNQIKKLEKMLIDYGVNLPDNYPINVPTPESKENYDDTYLFNLLLLGIRNANTIHGFGIRELIINDEPGELFKELIYDEIYYIDKLIRYGKIKGWVPLVPIYRP